LVSEIIIHGAWIYVALIAGFAVYFVVSSRSNFVHLSPRWSELVILLLLVLGSLALRQYVVFHTHNVYFDETDFNVRAGRKGWKLLILPAAKVYHEESATMNKFLGRKAWLLLRNLVIFELKNARPYQLAVFFPYFLFFHLPQFFLRGLYYAYSIRREKSSP